MARSRPLTTFAVAFGIAGLVLLAVLYWPVFADSWPVFADSNVHRPSKSADEKVATIGLIVLLIDYWDEKGGKISAVSRDELEAWALSKDEQVYMLRSLKRAEFDWEVNPTFIGKRYEDVPEDGTLVFLRGHSSASALKPDGLYVPRPPAQIK